MKIKKSSLLIHLFIFQVFLFFSCLLCSRNNTVDPEPTCINDQPVEDTTRVYLHPVSRDTLWLCPKRLFVRFFPWVTDTNKIINLLNKYELQRNPDFFATRYDQITAKLDIKRKRAEYYFTPYGKEGFCNFGSDSLVEYSFGIFDNDYRYPSGEIVFKFNEGITHSQIDSFFNANGLRFLNARPDYPSGIRYWTLITPHSKKNVLDLGYELQFDPLINICSVVIAYEMYPPN